MVPDPDDPAGGAEDELLDRERLLFGSRREAVLELGEVMRYGADTFGNPAHVSIYGMGPEQWHARGVRVLGRTAVECTRDALAQRMADDMAAAAGSSRLDGRDVVVLDPFAGSGNTLLWIQRAFPGSQAVGFESDPVIHALTERNLALIGAPVEVRHIDFAAGLAALDVPRDSALVVFVAPPWGRAFDPEAGLDLARTQPPVVDVLDAVVARFHDLPLLLAVQALERMRAASVAEVTSRWEWTRRYVYPLNPSSFNPALVLGGHGWPPAAAAAPRRAV